eukprot:COSAG01_NODE_32954_length_572_cov_2.723044_1_plen_154_part_10
MSCPGCLVWSARGASRSWSGSMTIAIAHNSTFNSNGANCRRCRAVLVRKLYRKYMSCIIKLLSTTPPVAFRLYTAAAGRCCFAALSLIAGRRIASSHLHHVGLMTMTLGRVTRGSASQLRRRRRRRARACRLAALGAARRNQARTQGTHSGASD